MEGYEQFARVSILTRENHESWFREMKLKLKAKAVFFTVEQKKDVYAWKPKLSNKILSPSTDKEKGPSIEILGGERDEEKLEKYEKAEAQALLFMVQSLGVEDADMIDEHETALAVWNALRQKYCKTNEFSANAYLASIAT
ncbi:hypothetical protein K3495_g17368, partial [Podosphaera aphanis]